MSAATQVFMYINLVLKALFVFYFIYKDINKSSAFLASCLSWVAHFLSNFPSTTASIMNLNLIVIKLIFHSLTHGRLNEDVNVSAANLWRTNDQQKKRCVHVCVHVCMCVYVCVLALCQLCVVQSSSASDKHRNVPWKSFPAFWAGCWWAHWIGARVSPLTRDQPSSLRTDLLCGDGVSTPRHRYDLRREMVVGAGERAFLQMMKR